MKLLFDENLSPKLTRLVGVFFADSQHVRELGLKGRTDEEIWAFAKANSFTIISKDKDFYQRALLYGSPPKFV
jgi:predicted nuclease of predicted toxin-antitoxin system